MAKIGLMVGCNRIVIKMCILNCAPMIHTVIPIDEYILSRFLNKVISILLPRLLAYLELQQTMYKF